MAARADQARHQSCHEAIEAVTSSKSVSATPLATKRAPQCAMADFTRGSVMGMRRPARLRAARRAVDRAISYSAACDGVAFLRAQYSGWLLERSSSSSVLKPGA